MKKSAGILVFRKISSEYEFLLVHPGGPFYRNKDLGSWSVPKGEFGDEENPLSAAKREFLEETSIPIDGDFIALKPVKQNSGKMVYTWAVEADIDVSNIKSNMFPLEWPPKSGIIQEFPEVDKAEWFTAETAKSKILNGQVPVVEELERKLAGRPNTI